MVCKKCIELQTLLNGANAMFTAIEMLYPDWHKFRDIAESIEWHTTSQDGVIKNLRRDNDNLREQISKVMATKKEIQERLDKILADERINYAPANIQINAPLALIQLALEVERDTLRWILNK